MIKRFLVFLALAMFLAASAAQAAPFELTNFETEVQAHNQSTLTIIEAFGQEFDTAEGSWHNVIGNPKIFGTGGMSLTGNADGFTFEIKTNFSGYVEIPTNGWKHYIGDLFLFTDSRIWGFDLGRWENDNGIPDEVHLYHITENIYTSDDYLENSTNLIYGGDYRATAADFTWGNYVTIFNKYGNNYGTNTTSSFTADFSRSETGGGSLDAGNFYTYTLTGNFNNLMDAMNLNWGNSFEVLFVTATCANSAMYAQVSTVPEPGTWLLLGTGLLGLSWLGRKRLARKK